MADVKQLQIDGSSYDIKDTVARGGLSDLIDIITQVKHAGAYVADGAAKLSLSIPLTETESTSVATAFSAIVPEFEGATELKSGMMVCIKNTVIASAAASSTPKCWTLNIKKSANDTGFGAKPVYVTTAAATYSTTQFSLNYKMLFIYDEDLNNGNGGWYIGQIFNSNTTYTNAALGQGYGTCTTAAATAAKVVTLSSYALTSNGIVAVKFDNDVPANATMNINSKGAKAIYDGDAPIADGVIRAGDVATFIYNTYYRLIAINRVDDRLFVVDFSEDGNGGWEANHTALEIFNAVNNGCVVVGRWLRKEEEGSNDGWEVLYANVEIDQDENRIEIGNGTTSFSYNSIDGWTRTVSTPAVINTNNATAQTPSSSESLYPNTTVNLHKVSKTGSYDDLLNKPTIPSDSAVVHKTGDETIEDNKTFTGSIVIDSDTGAMLEGTTNDFDWISNGTDTLQDALDEKQDTPLVIEVDETDTTVPSGTYASITAALAAGKDVIVKVACTEDAGQVYICRINIDDSTEEDYVFTTNIAAEYYWCDIDILNNFTFYNRTLADDLSSAFASLYHTHGNITSDGKLQTNDITIANGDKLIVTDASNSNRVARTSLTFDGSTTTQALSKKGTWETFYQKPSTGIPASDLATAVSQRLLPEGNGSTDDGKIVQYSYTGGGWQLVSPDTTPTSGSNKPITSGAVYTALGDIETLLAAI